MKLLTAKNGGAYLTAKNFCVRSDMPADVEAGGGGGGEFSAVSYERLAVSDYGLMSVKVYEVSEVSKVPEAPEG